MRHANDSRKMRTVRSLAYRRTCSGLRHKLPIFLIAAIAGLSLSVLDRSKTSYETARNTPLEINEEFVQAAKQGTWTKHLADPYHFKYQKYSNQRELLDALAAKAIAADAIYQSKLESERLELADKHEREKAELNQKVLQARKTKADVERQREALTSVSSRRNAKARKLDRDLEAANKTIADNEQKLEDLKQRYDDDLKRIADNMTQLAQESSKKIDGIYNDFGADLPRVVLLVQNKPQGLFDKLLKPFLDEKSSLFIVFQIFRITSLIVLALSFVFVLAMVLRQLPLATGSDTLTDQIKGLLSLRPVGSNQELAKSAILSVAALGVGTAVVVAGNSINDKANRALEIASASGSASPFNSNLLMRDAYYGRNNTYNSSTNRESNPLPPVFSPTNNVTSPQPVVRIVEVADRAGTRALVAELNAIASRPLTELATLKTTVSKAQQDISEIKDGLRGFGEKASQANASLTTIGTSLQKISANNLDCCNDQASHWNEVNSKLNLISNNIDGMRGDNLVRTLKSDGRNLFSRASQLFGSESFAVSDQAYRALKALLPQSEEFAPILKALDNSKANPPAGKRTFLQNLRAATKAEAKSEAKDALLNLKHWEALILSYTRLPR